MNNAQRIASDSLQAHITLAGEYWPHVDLSNVFMTFDLRGQSAGMAFWKTGKVRLNNGLLTGDTVEEMTQQTVPHELAHIIAGRMMGRKMGHGSLWKRIMRKFGLDPDRCHEMEVAHLKTRHERSYPAACGCASRTSLSVRRGNRMLRTGCTYRCGGCRQVITITGALS
jgi:SprT protein